MIIKIMQFNNPILITGAERSGSTLIARTLQLCGAYEGTVNVMHENLFVKKVNTSFINRNKDRCFMPDLTTIDRDINWKKKIDTLLSADGFSDKAFLYKDSGLAQVWPLWHDAYPKAKWIIVRRRTGDIIHSCVETAYMKRFKNSSNRQLVGADTEKEGWLWWVRQYENRFIEMMEAGLDCKVVWPERMKEGDFEQMQEIVEWTNLTWNNEVVEMMESLFKK